MLVYQGAVGFETWMGRPAPVKAMFEAAQCGVDKAAREHQGVAMIRFLTAGESHGQGLVVIVEGMPAGLSINEEYIGTQMARRQRGHGRGGRMQIEKDWAHVVSGIRHGRTLGVPSR